MHVLYYIVLIVPHGLTNDTISPLCLLSALCKFTTRKWPTFWSSVSEISRKCFCTFYQKLHTVVLNRFKLETVFTLIPLRIVFMCFVRTLCHYYNSHWITSDLLCLALCKARLKLLYTYLQVRKCDPDVPSRILPSFHLKPAATISISSIRVM